MGAFKRAVFSNIHHKKRFLLMFFIIFISSALFQVSYQIKLSATASVEEIKKDIGVSVTAFLAEKELVAIDDTSFYSYDVAQQLAALPEVRESKYLSIVDVFGEDVHGFTSSFYDVIEKDYPDVGDLQVIGVTDMRSYWDFKNDICNLEEGRNITAADDEMPYAVISQSLSNLYLLKLGDTITIRSSTNDYITLTIIGIHSGDDDCLPECLGNINAIYAPVYVAIRMNGDKGIMEAEYMLYDPDKLDSFLSNAKSIADENHLSIEFINNNLDFLLASTALNSLIKTCDAIFIMVVALSAIILSLLVIYLMNDRLFEIGVLLSLGESRYKISLQMILEILMPALIAINIGVLVSSVIIPAVGKAVAAGMQIDQQLTSKNIGALFLLANVCGILLIFMASIIPTIAIRKYTPKQIMQTFK